MKKRLSYLLISFFILLLFTSITFQHFYCAQTKPISAVLQARKSIEESIVYLAESGSLPILNLYHKKILLISDDLSHQEFVNSLRLYYPVDQKVYQSPLKLDSVLRLINFYNYIIVQPTSSVMTGLMRDFSMRCSQKQLIVYSNEAFEILGEIKKKCAIVFSATSNPLTDDLAAQLIFGGLDADNKLATDVAGFKKGEGNSIKKIRLKYSIPEEVGIHSEDLQKIDMIAKDGIKKKAFPGCQILLAKDGIVFYRKAFGSSTYESRIPLTNDQIYDLASVSKIAGVVPSLMSLYDDGKFKPDAKISDYLTDLVATDKGDLRCSELLLHEAGLPIWMPYFSKIFTDKHYKKLKPEYFSTTQTGNITIPISSQIYMNEAFPDSFLKYVYRVKLKADKKYDYTDLGFYFLKEAVERISNQKLEEFTEQNFFAPLGATTLCYHPLNHFSKQQIVPTERDKLIRNELLQGYVHDPGAALMGGVAGHAGLFSNANDLAKLMQLYLQNGKYGGYTYFKKNTVTAFTQPQTDAKSSRGLGFDKQRGGPISPMVSPLSYGHTGFTGTVAWNDPKYNLVYVFLSNRVYPDAANKKIQEMAIRKKIQEVVYKAIKR